ncbi:MAG: T9SS type A sorting domain-containing protein, partial [FCB group bacterium]|nr:T9SS type A sorting domain-containing protein [FCB group bacterium]
TLRAFPDTSAVVATVFTSQPGRIRLRSIPGWTGVSRIMVTVTDDGIGELSDTTYFNLTVTHNTSIAGIPEEFKVYPNYPNPFNPATTLRFDLPASEHVCVEIFNTKGQRVAVLANRHFEAGSHRLSFDGNAFVSGVYFYKISAGGQFRVERMTLIK